MSNCWGMFYFFYLHHLLLFHSAPKLSTLIAFTCFLTFNSFNFNSNWLDFRGSQIASLRRFVELIDEIHSNEVGARGRWCDTFRRMANLREGGESTRRIGNSGSIHPCHPSTTPSWPRRDPSPLMLHPKLFPLFSSHLIVIMARLIILWLVSHRSIFFLINRFRVIDSTWNHFIGSSRAFSGMHRVRQLERRGKLPNPISDAKGIQSLEWFNHTI